MVPACPHRSVVATLHGTCVPASNDGVPAAIALLVLSDWRRRRASLVALVLLIGLAGGVVLTAAAGARRTASSLDRLAATTASADVVINVGQLEPPTIAAITDLPMVERSGAFSVVFAVVEGVEEDLGLWIPRDDAAGVTVERDRLLEGRRPDPASHDEIVVNETAAQITGIGVGDTFTISTLTPEQVAAEEYFPARGPALDVRVVGLTRGPGDLISRGEGAFVTSPAVWDDIDGRAEVFTTFLGVDLVEGTTPVQLDEAVAAIVPEDAEYGLLPFEVRAKPIRETLSALAVGLAVFALIAAAAAAVSITQAVSRHLAAAGVEQRVLDALGMPRRVRRTALILITVPLAVGGAVLAVLTAVLASPLMPIGLGRRAEPDPGLRVDLVVIALGAVAVAALVLIAAAVAARLVSRVTPPRPSPSTSTATATALRSGAGPVVAVGVSLALDRRPPALPVRSAIAGVTLAILGTVGVLTFASSLDRLVATPGRWGYPWDLSLDFTSGEVEQAAEQVVDDQRLSAVARWDAGFSYVNGEGARAFGLQPLRGDIGFSLRSGRQPVSAREIVLGPVTAERLGVDVGDSVQVAAQPGAEQATLQVVGTALFPEIDEGNFTDAVGYFGDGFGDHATVPNLFEASQVVALVAPGQDLEALVASLAEEYPESISPDRLPSPPGSVGNLAVLRTLPKVLAAFVAALGVASLLHTLVTTLRRRRRGLATLRGLGFTRRQTVGCIVWQALTIGLTGLVVGIPFGLVAGRVAWWAVADPIGVVTSISRPWMGVVAVTGGALGAAVLLASSLAAATGRLSPAAALRSE